MAYSNWTKITSAMAEVEIGAINLVLALRGLDTLSFGDRPVLLRIAKIAEELAVVLRELAELPETFSRNSDSKNRDAA